MAGTFPNIREVLQFTWLALALTCGSVGLPGFGYGQDERGRELRVKEIKIVGNKVISTTKVLSLLKTVPGGVYRRSVAEEDVRRLAQLGQFKNVCADLFPTPSSGKDAIDWVDVVFRVEEYPNVTTEVQIRGGEHLRQEDLATLKLIRKGLPLNQALNLRASYEMREYYHCQGYAFARVDLVEGRGWSDTRVIFDIAEGPLVRVRSIRLTGKSRLLPVAREFFANNAKKQIGIRRGSPFFEGLLDTAPCQLTDAYRDRGQPDVRILVEKHFSEDNRFVDIIVHVQ